LAEQKKAAIKQAQKQRDEHVYEQRDKGEETQFEAIRAEKMLQK
jgi:hypothetical protein